MKKYLYLILFIAGLSGKSIAGTIYVDVTAAGANNGTSWADAYTTLDAALAEANANIGADEILIAAGIYYPTGTQDSVNREATFGIFRGGIKIYGGYPNGGGIRDISANIVILDGGTGTAETTDNCYHVMVINNIPSTADSIVVDGLTIRNGNANAQGSAAINGQPVSRTAGGGLVVMKMNSGLKTCIRNCHFEDNRVKSVTTSTPGPGGPGNTITVSGKGAGIYVNDASPHIYNCTFTNNYANDKGEGGAIFLAWDHSLVEKCTFTGNKAREDGTAIHCSTMSKAHINNCTLTDNSNMLGSQYASSVIYCHSYNSCYPTIEGCLIYNNTGDGIAGPSEIIHCTVSNNMNGYTNSLGPAEKVRILNSIFYGNTVSSINTGINEDEGVVEIEYSLIEGSFPGTGNISANPYFAEETTGNYRLLANSAAINAGNNTFTISAGITLDFDGNDRFVGNAVDMGAFEYPDEISTAGLSGIDENLVSIYPNPAADILHISCTQSLHARIFSTDGKMLFQQENVEMINIAFLPAGLYMIYLRSNDGKLAISKRFKKLN